MAPDVIPASLRALLAGLATRGLHVPDATARVVRVTEGIGRQLGLDAATQQLTVQVCLAKDVGLLLLPDRLLHAAGPLTASEREALCQAPVFAAQLIGDVVALQRLAPLVRAVRERWDGSGYPDGLAGDEIPLPARVVGLADAYDALRTDRPYRRALAPEQAIAVIAANDGTQFWPDAVAALTRELEALSLLPAADPWRPGAAATMTTAQLVHAAFAARGGPTEPQVPFASDDPLVPGGSPDPADSLEPEPAPPVDEPTAEADDALQRLLAVPVASGPPTLRAADPRPARRLPVGGVLAAIVGLALGLVFALPIEDVTGRCPPPGEGLVQCQLQKAYLPAVTLVIVAVVACLVLANLLFVRAPRLYGRWQRGELRPAAQPDFEKDPILRAANWGLTYRDAHPERLVARGRSWRRDDE